MPRKKLWKFTAGPYGARARVAELTWGGSVYVFAYDAGRKFPRRKSLRFAVRDAEGKIIPEAEERAKREAVELSNKLIMGESLAKEITLDELFGLFRREVVSSMGARNRDEMERELELWTNFLGSRFPIAKLGTAEWNALVRQRVSGEIDGRGKRFKDPKERRVVGPRTVAKSLKALRQVCRFGASYRLQSGTFLLAGDPTRGLEIPREPNPKAPIADHARFQKLLEVADQVTIRMPGWKHLPSGKRVPCWKRVPTYLRELLVIAEGTGRRIGAILALRYSDWDTEAPPHGALRWRADRDKVKRDWWTPVTPEVRKVIEEILRKRPGIGDAPLFPGPETPQKPVGDRLVYGWLRKAEGKAKLPHLERGAWHMFRRLFATAHKNASLKDVAALGGWKDVQTLLRLYQREDWETMAEAVQQKRTIRVGR